MPGLPILSQLPYGRRGSRHMIVRQGDTLWLAIAAEGAPTMIPAAPRPAGLFEIALVKDGTPETYTVDASPSLAVLKSASGSVRITHDVDAGALRFEAENLTLRLDSKMPSGMGVTSLNAAEGAYVSVGGGRYFFKTRQGKAAFDDAWVLNKFGSVTPVLEITPDGGKIDLVAFDLPADTNAPEITKTFDECAAQNEADFAAFKDIIVNVPERFTRLRELAAYLLWLNVKTLPNGKNAVADNRLTSTTITPYRQAFASLAFTDANFIAEILTALPAASPPLIGYAASSLIERGMLGAVGVSLLRELRDALYACAEWWRNNRSVEKHEAGCNYYAYRYETGVENPAYFKVDAPVFAPDLAAELALVYEALGGISEQLGDAENAKKWKDIGRLRSAPVNDGVLLGGGLSLAAGEYSEADKILSYIPLILGTRLSEKAKAFLFELDENDRFTMFDALIILGLKTAGENEKAGKLALAALEKAAAEGITDPVYGAALLALAANAL